MCAERRRQHGSEPVTEFAEESRQGQIRLRRGIVASRMQRPRRRRSLVVRMIVLLALVAWVVLWWYMNN